MIETGCVSNPPARPRGGRRPRNETPARVVLRFRLTDDEFRRAQRVAQENATTIADVVREALNEYVADYDEARQIFDVQNPPTKPGRGPRMRRL